MSENDEQVRVIFNHSKIPAPSGDVLVTIVTFAEPFCSNINFVVQMRDNIARVMPDQKGALYVFPLEDDKTVRFGIVFEGHIGDEIGAVLSKDTDKPTTEDEHKDKL